MVQVHSCLIKRDFCSFLEAMTKLLDKPTMAYNKAKKTITYKCVVLASVLYFFTLRLTLFLIRFQILSKNELRIFIKLFLQKVKHIL